MEALELFFTTSLWAAAIRIASPLIFATMGELICERAGVLNLGIEGIMTVGAFAGWITVYAGAPLWVGVAAAAIAGASFGLLHGILVVPFGLSQHVTGIGITLLASSLTYYTYRLALPEVTSPPKIEPFQPLDTPFEILNQTPLTYLAFATVAITAWFLYKTPAGLALRAVGENPAAAEAQGIPVNAVRIAAVMGARKLRSDDPSERADERVVEVVVNAEAAPVLVGQRVLVKFLKDGTEAAPVAATPAAAAATVGGN